MPLIKPLATLGLAAFALAACEARPADAPLANVSARALEALPSAIPQALLIRNAEGCYGVEIEKTTPRTGVPLVDRDGNQVCDA